MNYMDISKFLQARRFAGDKDFKSCNEWIRKNSKVIEVRDVQLRTDHNGVDFVLLFYGIQKEDVEKLE